MYEPKCDKANNTSSSKIVSLGPSESFVSCSLHDYLAKDDSKINKFSSLEHLELRR